MLGFEFLRLQNYLPLVREAPSYLQVTLKVGCNTNAGSRTSALKTETALKVHQEIITSFMILNALQPEVWSLGACRVPEFTEWQANCPIVAPQFECLD